MAQWLGENPWRQGHLLAPESARILELFHLKSPDDTAVMVISHDCDLAQSVETEPICEVIVGRKILRQEGNFANAKSIRRLHLKMSTASDGVAIIELDAGAKGLIEKGSLASHVPDGSFALDVSEGTILRAWLGARYNRASFPDEFDRRLTKEANKAYGKLLKIFKATSDDIIAVFFDVDGGKEVDRAGPDDTYSLAIYLLFSAETDPEKAKRTAAAAAESITKIFREHFLVQHKWQNIELVSCEVTAESECPCVPVI